jgi:hypothetical protein
MQRCKSRMRRRIVMVSTSRDIIHLNLHIYKIFYMWRLQLMVMMVLLFHSLWKMVYSKTHVKREPPAKIDCESSK